MSKVYLAQMFGLNVGVFSKSEKAWETLKQMVRDEGEVEERLIPMHVEGVGKVLEFTVDEDKSEEAKATMYHLKKMVGGHSAPGPLPIPDRVNVMDESTGKIKSIKKSEYLKKV